MEVIDLLLSALLFIAPAYAANAAPLAFSPILKTKHPIDFGLTLPNGARLLGETKSWEGLAIGIAIGTAVGFALAAPVRGFILSLGALLGDLAGSFIKRRLSIPPGQPLPLLDQLDFLAGSLLLAALFNYGVGLFELLILVVITPPLHIMSNALAYAMGIKAKPY